MYCRIHRGAYFSLVLLVLATLQNWRGERFLQNVPGSERSQFCEWGFYFLAHMGGVSSPPVCQVTCTPSIQFWKFDETFLGHYIARYTSIDANILGVIYHLFFISIFWGVTFLYTPLFGEYSLIIAKMLRVIYVLSTPFHFTSTSTVLTE